MRVTQQAALMRSLRALATTQGIDLDHLLDSAGLHLSGMEIVPRTQPLTTVELDALAANDQQARGETETLTMRKKLFNAAAAVSGYFDAEEMLNKKLPYNEQLTRLARLIARELDVEEAIR